MRTLTLGRWLELSAMRCALCGAPAWPGLWRWCSAVYCSPVCRDIELIPERVPCYPMQSNYATREA